MIPLMTANRSADVLPFPSSDSAAAPLPAAGGARPGPFDPEDDAALVNAVVADVPGAWSLFQSRYERLVVSCVTKTVRCYTGQLLKDDLADLVSTVWLHLIKDGYGKLRAYDQQRSKLSSWVGLIATNAAIDWLRRLHPAGEDVVKVKDEVAHELPAPEQTDPLAQYEQAEQAWLIARARARLSAADQSFLTAVLAEDVVPEALATELHLSVATIYSRKNKVIAKLRTIVLQLSRG
jgi:RNA polymerase sigma-70 factor, ECF subfamily